MRNELEMPSHCDVSAQEHGSGRWAAAAFGRVALRGKEHVRRRAYDGRELPEAVHAAGWARAPRPHVHDPAALRLQLLLGETTDGSDAAKTYPIWEVGQNFKDGRRCGLSHGRLDVPCRTVVASLLNVK